MIYTALQIIRFDSFDFAILEDGSDDVEFLIECQGAQHYEPKPKFGGPAGLRKQQTYDRLKREYCKEHGIPLVIIPYWDENKINLDYILIRAGYGS